METTWRVPRLWRLLLSLAPALVFPICRLRVTGTVPAQLRDGPLILAANHVSPVDPMIMAAACRRVGLAPRFMATGGIFRTPVVGAVMRHCGHLRVDRGRADIVRALPDAAAALQARSVVLVYPEGRIGLDPWMWPERGKTGAARLAVMSGAPVIPVAQWGAHEVLPYTAPTGMWRGLARAIRRRPTVQVSFGDPVDLFGVAGSAASQAVHATQLIIEAIDRALAPLRVDEPQLPRYVDTSRPHDTSRVRPRQHPEH